MWLGRLEPTFVVIWLACTAAATGVALWLLRRSRPPRWSRLLGWVAVAAPLLAAMASLVILGSGTHPLVQVNDPEHLGWWRAWSLLWLLLVSGTLAGGGASLVLSARRREGWHGRVGWVLLLGTNALAHVAVIRNFPSA